jgi:hypothetical protein
MYSIKILRSIEDIESFREEWEKLQWHSHTDIDFYKLILTSRKEILAPHVLVILGIPQSPGLSYAGWKTELLIAKLI